MQCETYRDMKEQQTEKTNTIPRNAIIFGIKPNHPQLTGTEDTKKGGTRQRAPNIPHGKI